jgi:uncharacterized protein YsxB (DUF464 family)
MIRIVARKKAGRFVLFRVSGHAGQSKAGADIVCAGVSALAQTALLALRQYLASAPPAKVRRGFLEVVLPELSGAEEEKTRLILEVILLGLSALRDAYPAYVQLDTQEE